MGDVRGVNRCDTCQYVKGLSDSHWGSVSFRNVYLRQSSGRCDKY